MKKNLILLLFLLSSFLGARAQEAMTLPEIQKMVAMLHSALPIHMGSGMKLTNLTLDSTVYAMTIDAGGAPVVSGPDGRKIQYQDLMNMAEKPNSRPLVLGLANHGIGMSYTIVNTRDGNDFITLFSAEDLKRALRGEGRLTPLEQLRLDVLKEQRGLPINLGDGMQETEYELMDGYLKVVITCNENLYTIDTLKGMLPAIRQNTLNSIQQSMLTKLVFTKCAAAGYGIKYIFSVGGETCSYYLSVSEISEYLQ